MANSPYELRLELLKLAADHCRDQYFWAKESAEREYDFMRGNSEGFTFASRKIELEKIEFPQPYTLEQVLDTAEKLRSFIDKKSNDDGTNKRLLNE